MFYCKYNRERVKHICIHLESCSCNWLQLQSQHLFVFIRDRDWNRICHGKYNRERVENIRAAFSGNNLGGVMAGSMVTFFKSTRRWGDHERGAKGR
jgi:hypothetical protein